MKRLSKVHFNFRSTLLLREMGLTMNCSKRWRFLTRTGHLKNNFFIRTSFNQRGLLTSFIRSPPPQGSMFCLNTIWYFSVWLSELPGYCHCLATVTAWLLYISMATIVKCRSWSVLQFVAYLSTLTTVPSPKGPSQKRSYLSYVVSGRVVAGRIRMGAQTGIHQTIPG